MIMTQIKNQIALILKKKRHCRVIYSDYDYNNCNLIHVTTGIVSL